MKKWLWLFFISGLLLCAGIFFSCKKKQVETSLPGSEGRLLPVPSATLLPVIPDKSSYPKSGLSAIPLANPIALSTPGTQQPLSNLPEEQQPKTIRLDEPVNQETKILLDKTGNNYPFLSEKTPVLYPVDYKIGPLQELAGNDKEQQSIITVLNSFLSGLINSNIKKTLLLKENSSALLSFLDYNLKKKSNVPVKFRIGKIEVKKDTAQINIRLYSAKGVTEGEVFVLKKENSWYISDIQINFDLLGNEYQGSKEKFMPTSYYWILNEK